MADPDEPLAVFITVADMEYELAPTNKLTFPEVRELKAASGGMTLKQVEEGIQEADPDAWVGWIFVSVRRKWPNLTLEEFFQAIGDTPMIEVIATVRQEEDEPSPPVVAADAAALTPSPDSNGSSTVTPLSSTPVISGPLT